MCSVSAISDYYTTTWPLRFPEQHIATFPEDIRKDLLEIIKRLDSIDKRLGDVECIDESKAKFIKELADGKET